MESVVAALCANALVLAALTYLVKSIMTHRLNKDLLEFKRTLESSAQREIEAYKAGLEKERLRLQISYGGIFEKQAETVLTLYKNILSLERSASAAVNSFEPVAERKQAFHHAWNEIYDSYDEHRILLPQKIDEMLSHFIVRMRRSVFEVANVDARDLTRVTEDEYKRLMDRQDKAYEIIESELPALKEKLIENMRDTVGVASQG